MEQSRRLRLNSPRRSNHLQNNPKIADATRKYTNSDIASTMVVMNGIAITAGSNPSRFARIGRRHPIIIAITTAATRVRHTDVDAPPAKLR